VDKCSTHLNTWSLSNVSETYQLLTNIVIIPGIVAIGIIWPIKSDLDLPNDHIGGMWIDVTDVNNRFRMLQDYGIF